MSSSLPACLDLSTKLCYMSERALVLGLGHGHEIPRGLSPCQHARWHRIPMRDPYSFVLSTKTLDHVCVVMPAGCDSRGKI